MTSHGTQIQNEHHRLQSPGRKIGVQRGEDTILHYKDGQLLGFDDQEERI